ncbi:MAG: EamA family transporter [Alphaproteobacteria bacterium]|nr:EamA family transporter [Alphaproteobacteria bacterium]
MNVTALWLIFTFAAILGMVGYDVAIKLATDQISAYLFTAILVVFGLIGHLTVLGVYKFYHPEVPLGASPKILLLGALGGLGLVVMDVCFFLGVKIGGLATTNAVWLIGGLIATVLVGALVFHEELSWNNMLGVALGTVAIFLMVF